MGQGNSADVFVQLFAQHTNSIYSYIHSLLPHHSDAEDVFQETSRVLWEKFSEYRSDGGFLVWALRISQFEVLRFRRSQRRRQHLFSEELFQLLEPSLHAAALRAEPRIEALGECLNKLPLRDRQLIEARYRQGASIQSLAEDSQTSQHVQYRKLRRIHQWLFDCVQRVAAREQGS